MGISRFDNCGPSQTVLQFATGYNLRLTGRQIWAFRALESVSKLPVPFLGTEIGKLSGQIPKKSRFAETIGGDWCDHDCRPRAGVKLIKFREKAY